MTWAVHMRRCSTTQHLMSSIGWRKSCVFVTVAGSSPSCLVEVAPQGGSNRCRWNPPVVPGTNLHVKHVWHFTWSTRRGRRTLTEHRHRIEKTIPILDQVEVRPMRSARKLTIRERISDLVCLPNQRHNRLDSLAGLLAACLALRRTLIHHQCINEVPCSQEEGKVSLGVGTLLFLLHHWQSLSQCTMMITAQSNDRVDSLNVKKYLKLWVCVP